MNDLEFVLTRNQRDEILKAVAAIGREVKDVATKEQWQALWIIGTNLTRIRTNLMNLRLGPSNPDRL